MGSVEYIIALCFVITIVSNTVNADIDCRRFVFAPSCRGVSAKRSQSTHISQGEMSDRLMDERSLPPIIPLEDSDSESETQNARRYQKRFRDLLKSSLLRRTRSKDMTRRTLLLKSLEELFGANNLEE